MDFPSNSQERRPRREEPPKPVKKIEKVVEGGVIRRKKSPGRRFKETFVGGDARSVWGFVLLDVLVPAAKDTITDVVSQGVERMMYGEVRSRSRRGRSPYGNSTYTSYGNQRYASTRPVDRDDGRTISRRSRAAHDFDEIVLETRVEAEEVIDQLFELVSRFESATVSDLYELVGADAKYTDNKWGWTDLRGAGVTRVRGGYLLDLPRPEPLEN